jgi:chemotaxis protein CheY-P-specific phosphatase CheC
MTFSAPLKIIVACFSIAALVVTVMNGSESSGLKGTRMLQLSAADAVNSIISNSQNTINQLNPARKPPTPPSASVVATNTVVAQSNNIFRYFNP